MEKKCKKFAEKSFGKMFTKNSTFAIIKMYMINKGELYMEHENVDENARYLTACENVKKIVNAIKSIKIKYYTNFAKISVEDKKIYDQLEANLEKISEENNLNTLKVVLMEEVSAKYDKREIKHEQGGPNSVDPRLLACYGVIDVQVKALSAGKIKKAIKCQEILKQYLKEIDITNYKELISNYKREKFGELIRNKDEVQKTNEGWMSYLEGCCQSEDVVERDAATQQIEEARTNSITLFRKPKEQNIPKSSLVFEKMEDEKVEELQIG